MSRKLWNVQTILVLILLPQIRVSGFSLVSHLNSVLAYGAALDRSGPKIITLGIDSNENQKEKTNCYISVGTANGFDRMVLDSPTMCLDLLFFNTSSSLQLPDGIISAMDGLQPKLFRLDYKSTISSRPKLEESINLPSGNFPTVMAIDKNKEKSGIYVALHDLNGLAWDDISKLSDNNSLATWEYLQQLTHPNIEMPDSYSPIVYKYNISTGQEEWQTLLETSEGKTFITGLETIASRNILVVVGTTNGYGPSTGEQQYSGGVWDGFLTLVDVETGKIENKNFGTYQSHTTRIQSQYNKDDFALGLCMWDDKAFVVGSTSGKMVGSEAGGGFVMKIDIDTLDIIWKKQFVGEGIKATHCDVQENNLFVGGIVPSGITLEENNLQVTADTDDIFIASFNAYNGEMIFLRQIDSHREDQLVGLDINPSSGEIFLTANAWDFSEGYTNLYVLSINEKGDHAWQNLSTGQDPITGMIPTKAPDEQPPSDTSPYTYRNDDKNNNGDSSDKLSHGESSKNIIGKLVTAVLVPTCFLIGVSVFCIFQKARKKDPVVENLQETALEDIAGENKIV